MDKTNRIKVDFKTILQQRVDEWNSGIIQGDSDGTESIKGKIKIDIETNFILFFYV